jgi:hypothetical protein
MQPAPGLMLTPVRTGAGGIKAAAQYATLDWRVNKSRQSGDAFVQ